MRLQEMKLFNKLKNNFIGNYFACISPALNLIVSPGFGIRRTISIHDNGWTSPFVLFNNIVRYYTKEVLCDDVTEALQYSAFLAMNIPCKQLVDHEILT